MLTMPQGKALEGGPFWGLSGCKDGCEGLHGGGGDENTTSGQAWTAAEQGTPPASQSSPSQGKGTKQNHDTGLGSRIPGDSNQSHEHSHLIWMWAACPTVPRHTAQH